MSWHKDDPQGAEAAKCKWDAHFVSKVDKQPNGCWIWMRGKSNDGYGMFAVNRRPIRAHRYSYQSFVGDIPKGHFVCHKCDNPLCVNPDHLFAALPSANSADMVLKNRQAKGQKHGMTKLSADAVVEIRASKETQQTLAKKFNVDRSTIGYVRRGDHWRHV